MYETFNREDARKRAEDEARRADMKQHADKLIQGFEKLEESHAKRAIWELFQNAIDLSENCEIIITITENALEFKHNGKPFTTKTLSSLIKQVSSKNPENNDDEVGQYGTGFITTHSFGKRILLSGSLKEGNYFIHFNDFEIDRIARNSDELIEKLIEQQDKVFDLINLENPPSLKVVMFFLVLPVFCIFVSCQITRNKVMLFGTVNIILFGVQSIAFVF